MLKHLKLLTFILSLFVTVALSAQNLLQRMTDDPSVGAGIYKPYFTDRGGGRLILNL